MNEKSEILQESNLNNNFEPIYTLPLLNEPAPPFKAESTKGSINFPADYKGKWVAFFSYPFDFCATCTTELLELAKNKAFYDELGVEIIGLSIDSIYSHLAWLESIYKLNYNGYKNTIIDFPIIADTSMEISRRYGLLRRGEKNTETVRGAFLVDPSGKIRVIQVYPREVGRGGDEIRRVIEAVIKTTNENVYTPANWQPGDDVLMPVPDTIDATIDREKQDVVDENIYCPDWYLCFKKDGTTSGTMSKKNNFSYKNIITRQTKNPYERSN